MDDLFFTAMTQQPALTRKQIEDLPRVVVRKAEQAPDSVAAENGVSDALGPTETVIRATRRAQTPTAEQVRIVEAVKSGKSIKIIAGAGCAKTTTLKFIAEAMPEAKILFIVYNEAAARDAKDRFPPNVTVLTAHGYAARETQGLWRHRVKSFVSAYEAARFLRKENNYRAGKAALDVVQRYCLSADAEIDKTHLAAVDGTEVLEDARRLWGAMSDVNGSLHVTHDVYLKMWTLHGDKPDFDIVLFDEAQDVWPALMAALERMRARTIYVGDQFQQLYSFRGATDALSKVPGTALSLSKSWRFGPAVAQMANDLMALRPVLGLPKPSLKLVGNDRRASEWETYSDFIPSPFLERGDFAIIHRTNSAIIKTALMTDPVLKLHITGRDRLDEILDVFRIWAGQPVVLHEMRRFTNWKMFSDVADGDFNYKVAKNLVLEHKSALPDIIANLRKRLVSSERNADIVLSTIHGAKGREFDEVLIADDIQTPVELYRKVLKAVHEGRKIDSDKIAEEMNINYVAATRAKLLLRIPLLMSPKIANEKINEIARQAHIAKIKNATDGPVFQKLSAGRGSFGV